MNQHLDDITGQRFGRLLVESLSPQRYHGQRVWNCVCDCGNRRTVVNQKLRNGRQVSCGCYRRDRSTKHGRHGHPLYPTWQGMLQRCYNSKHHSFSNYGGKGISVCDRWRTSFDDFATDVGERPLGMTLDRIDPGGNYEASNIRWATPKQQQRNRIANVVNDVEVMQIRWLVGDGGYRQCDVARAFGLNPKTVSDIVIGKRWKAA